MASAGLLDPTKAGKYPVILSDALLGKDSGELYTGVRYNHKPNLSSPIAPESARLKPAAGAAKKGNSYDLSFLDNDERYTYQGSRRTEDGHYVLIFDSSREVFILHKVDSLFNMNLTRTPGNTDAESLRREHPQLDGGRAADAKPATAKTKEGKPRKQPAPAAKKKESEKKVTLPMPESRAPPPKPAPPPPKPKHVQPEEDSEEDESDDDFGLTIENPGGDDLSTAPSRMFSPAFGARKFQDFMQEHREASEEQEREAAAGQDQDEESEHEDDHEEEHHGHGGGAAMDEDDADGEDDDDDDDSRSIENFKLPSPMRRQMETHQNGIGIGHQNHQQQQPQQQQVEEEVSEEDEEPMVDVEPADDEDDLEAEFMAALEEDHQDQESDVSEEE